MIFVLFRKNEENKRIRHYQVKKKNVKTYALFTAHHTHTHTQTRMQSSKNPTHEFIIPLAKSAIVRRTQNQMNYSGELETNLEPVFHPISFDRQSNTVQTPPHRMYTFAVLFPNPD